MFFIISIISFIVLPRNSISISLLLRANTMSRSRIRLNTTTTTSLLLVFLFLFVYVQSTGDDSADSVTPFLRSTIVLPLTLSAPDSSRALFHYRRHLQISESYSNSTARMRLYDGLIRQGYPASSPFSLITFVLFMLFC